MEKKGQAAVELVIILALALVIILAIVSLSEKSAISASGQYESAKAKATLDDLADAAKLVYQEGWGSVTKLYLSIPENVLSTNVSSSRITMKVATATGQGDIFRNLDFGVVGSIPTEAGNYWVYVEAKDGYVQITPNVTIGEICGNKIMAEDEVCDGTDFGLVSCVTLGYHSGYLRCMPDCRSFDESMCINTHAECLFLNTTNTALTSGNKKLTGLKIKNNCTEDVLLVQANITWIADGGEKTEKITIDNQDKWDRNCNWGCTPTGSQNSGILLDFGSRDYSLQSTHTVNIDWIDFNSNMAGKNFRLAFIFNDKSVAANDINFP